MKTTVRLPDGSEVDVPTNDPKVAAAAARKHWEQRQGAPKPRSGWQTAGDFLGDAIDNFVPNFGDEIAAIPDAAKAAVKGQPIGEAWNKGRKEFRRNQDQYDKEHPNLAWASTLTGAGASLALPAGRVASGAGMAAKMLHGAAVGAAYGGVAGAGEGESLSDRATNAAKGAAGGALFGSAAAPIGQAAVSVGRRARMNVPGADTAIRRLANVPRAVMRRPLVGPGQRAVEQADRMVGQHMSQGAISRGMGREGPAATPEAIATEMERRQAIGVPAMPGDTTDAMRNVTSWASRGMGPGQSMVRQRLDARKAQEATRVRQHIVDEMGPAVDPVRQMQDYGERARREAAPMYAEAYAQPMVLTPEMRGIIQTPAFQDAVPHAVRNIRNAQRNPEALGFVMRGDGMLDPEAYQYLSTEGFDQVIRAMRDNAQDRMRPASFPGGRPTNTTDSVHISARAGDLRDELAAQNGAYRDVQAMYADEMGMRDAFRNGQDIKSLTGSEIGEQARQMPQANAREAWSIGARTALADEASEYGAKYPTGDTAAMVRKLLGDDFKQGEIGAMTGRPNAVNGLQDRLEAEHQGNILWKEVQGNSKTAPRQQLDADLDAAAGTRPLSSLSVRGMLGAVVNNISDRATTQFRNDVKARVAQIATETNPATVRELMANVADRARQDREFADLLHRSGVIASKAAGANIAPAAPDEEQ
jgi:hypothetical protein